MNTEKIMQNAVGDDKINVKLKLASLWTAFMFLYIYVDYFHLYMPNQLQDILKGKVFTFEITQGFIMFALGMATIPMLMIFLSIALSAKINQWTNIIVATIHVPYMLFNLVGEVWAHMVFAAIVEIVLLGLIIGYAWKWRSL